MSLFIAVLTSLLSSTGTDSTAQSSFELANFSSSSKILSANDDDEEQIELGKVWTIVCSFEDVFNTAEVDTPAVVNEDTATFDNEAEGLPYSSESTVGTIGEDIFEWESSVDSIGEDSFEWESSVDSKSEDSPEREPERESVGTEFFNLPF